MSRALALALAVSAAAHAQAPPPPPAPPVEEAWVDLEDAAGLDSALIPTQDLRPLAPPDSLLAAYRADPAFQYDRPEAEGPSLWDRFWAWVDRTFLRPLFDNTTASFRQWMVVLLGVLLLGWAVGRLLRAEGSGLFGRRDRGAPEAGPLLDVEDIAEADVAALLGRALAADDFREAVRYRYLLVLQALEAAGAIAWRRDKTNRAYLAEVRERDPGRARPFGDATRVFDYVWYGERPVDRARYAALAPLFDRAEAGLGQPAPVR